LSSVSWSASCRVRPALDVPMTTPPPLVDLVPRIRLGLLLASLVPSACTAPKSEAGQARPVLVDIRESVTPLAAWFDRHGDEPRAILLLSPV